MRACAEGSGTVRAIAEALAQAGAHTVLLARGADRLDDVAAGLRERGWPWRPSSPTSPPATAYGVSKCGLESLARSQSEASGYVTGHSLFVDGGFSVH